MLAPRRELMTQSCEEQEWIREKKEEPLQSKRQ